MKRGVVEMMEAMHALMEALSREDVVIDASPAALVALNAARQKAHAALRALLSEGEG